METQTLSFHSQTVSEGQRGKLTPKESREDAHTVLRGAELQGPIGFYGPMDLQGPGKWLTNKGMAGATRYGGGIQGV